MCVCKIVNGQQGWYYNLKENLDKEKQYDRAGEDGL